MAIVHSSVKQAASGLVTEILNAIGRKPGDDETVGVVLEKAFSKFAGAILDQVKMEGSGPTRST